MNLLTRVREAYDDIWLMYIGASCKAIGIGGFFYLWLMSLS